MEDKEEVKQVDGQEEVEDIEVVKIPRKNVLYCQICSMPPEYCMYQSNSKLRKCQEWLRINNPQLYVKFYLEPEQRKLEEAKNNPQPPAGENATKTEGSSEQPEEKKEQTKPAEKPQALLLPVSQIDESTLTPEELEKLEIQRQKQTAKLMMDIQGDDNKITILTTRRKFKKFITVVTGLSKYGVSLKEAAKRFRHKFACGAKEEGDEIEIQGEVDEVIADFIIKEWKHINKNVFVYKKDGPKK